MESANTTWRDRLAGELTEGRLTADELLSRDCTLAYWRDGSYVGAAERLGIDRRTVKARIGADLLAELQATGRGGDPR